MQKLTAIVVALTFFGWASMADAKKQQSSSQGGSGGGKTQTITQNPTGPADSGGQSKDPGGGSSKRSSGKSKR